MSTPSSVNRHLPRRLFAIAGWCAIVLSSVGCSEAPSNTDKAEQRPAAISLPSLPTISLTELAPTVRVQFEELQTKLAANELDGRLNSQYAKLLHAYSLHGPASVMYERCEKLRPSDLDCVYLKALVAKELGNFELAIESLNKVLARQPNYPRARLVLADSYRAIGQLDLAIDVFQQELKKRPDHLEANYGLAQAYLANNDFAAAEKPLLTMHQNGQHFGVVHSMLATLARRAKEPQKMAFHTNAATRYADNKIPFKDEKLWQVQDLQQGDGRYIREANALFKRGQYREAAQRFEKALELNPDNDSVHADLVGIYGELGQISNAERHFEQAVTLNSKNILAHMNLGTVRMKRGEFGKAQVLFANVLKRQPHHAEARTLRAYCSELLRQDVDVDEYQQALADAPNYHLANYLYGRHVRDTQGCETALVYLHKSVQIETSSTPAYQSDIANCYLELGQPGKAQEVVTEGLALAAKYRNASAQQSLENLQKKMTQTK